MCLSRLHDGRCWELGRRVDNSLPMQELPPPAPPEALNDPQLLAEWNDIWTLPLEARDNALIGYVKKIMALKKSLDNAYPGKISSVFF